MTDYESENAAVIARNAGNSFELLLHLLHQETAIIRGHLRRFGETVRQFFQHHIKKKDVYAESILKLAAKANAANMELLDDSRELNFYGKLYDIPLRTFVDIAEVLLNDEDEGVICKLPLKNPKWKKLPDYSPIMTKETDTCEFQLWNRPMGSPCTMPDDEEERLSLPSTRATDWGREKIDSVEAQLALLTRQMHHLLQLQQQQNAPAPRAKNRSPILSDSSEDEGRGASLNSVICSPLFKDKTKVEKENKMPSIAPPSGLPPPPPPPPPQFFLKSVENKIVASIKEEKPEQQQRPVRPTAADLRNVQLRKVEARSPGGTPQGKQRKGSSDSVQDSANILANALMERFRSIQGPVAEQDEPDTSWTDD